MYLVKHIELVKKFLVFDTRKSNEYVIVIVTTMADWEDAKVKHQKQNFKKK